MRSIIQNKKGQFDYPIVTFIALIFGLMILGIFILKIWNSFSVPFASSLANVSVGGAQASTNFNTVMNTAINFWDKVLVSAFMLAVILLFISAYFIDAHPIFLIVYVLFSFMVMLFAPNIMQAMDSIYDSPSFATESAQLTFMNTIRTHFGEFLTGIMIITAIIIYAKLAIINRR